MALIDRLKHEFGPDELVYRWPADNLSLGAQLIVNESQEALFFKGGKALDLFGPGTHTLSSANLPLLQKLVNLPFGGKTPFAAEVYFVNKTVAFAQDWGTSTPIMLLDPRYRVTIPLRGYGQYAVRIENSREFVVHVVDTAPGAHASTTAQHMLASPIVACIQQSFGEYLVQKKVSALELPAHTLALVGSVTTLLRTHYRTFGVDVVNFTVESINFDPEDPSVSRLRGMLDEAARLEVIGGAFRNNQDFYRTERQFDVLKGAAENSGAAGGLLGAAMGVGMGFGIAGPAGEVAKQSMGPVPPAALSCPKCHAPAKLGSAFCSECGERLSEQPLFCPECKTPNAPSAKFCGACGKSLGAVTCTNCGAIVISNGKYCPDCGTQA